MVDWASERLRLNTFHLLFPLVTWSRCVVLHCMGAAEGLLWWFLHLPLLFPICGLLGFFS